MPVFTFDQQNHRYYLDGERIPGVTTIIKEAGLCHDYSGFSEAQYRGLHVHLACEYLDLKDLDWGSVNPKYAGYVRSYDLFKKHTGFKPELIEYQTYHPTLLYAGTMDRRGLLYQHQAQIDLKTGYKEDWHKIQTAGYRELKPDEWKYDKRYSLYLKEDGSMPELVEHDDPTDRGYFLAAYALFQLKLKWGIFKWETKQLN